MAMFAYMAMRPCTNAQIDWYTKLGKHWLQNNNNMKMESRSPSGLAPELIPKHLHLPTHEARRSPDSCALQSGAAPVLDPHALVVEPRIAVPHDAQKQSVPSSSNRSSSLHCRRFVHRHSSPRQPRWSPTRGRAGQSRQPPHETNSRRP